MLRGRPLTAQVGAPIEQLLGDDRLVLAADLPARAALRGDERACVAGPTDW
jgi:hypothetical protein